MPMPMQMGNSNKIGKGIVQMAGTPWAYIINGTKARNSFKFHPENVQNFPYSH